MGELLEGASKDAQVHDYRCPRCGHGWTHQKGAGLTAARCDDRARAVKVAACTKSGPGWKPPSVTKMPPSKRGARTAEAMWSLGPRDIPVVGCRDHPRSADEPRLTFGAVSGGDKFDSCGGRKSDSRQHGLAAG
jgi:hypothetical protein